MRTVLLFIGHLLNDGYSGFFAALLPLLIVRLDLSLALAGLLGTVRTVVNSLLQPGLGHLVDRSQRPALVIVGPLLTISAMCLIGRVGSFGQLLVVMLIAGIGTALFHPAAASLVSAGAHGGRGLLMALFSSGGTLGGAIAPVVIVAYTTAFGMDQTPWLLLPGLVILLGFALPLRGCLPKSERRVHERFRLGKIPRRLVVLWIAILFRATTATAFADFLAVLVVQRGGSPMSGGIAITILLVTGALGGFVAGSLSDRWGRKTVILGTLLLAVPSLLLFLHGPMSLLFPAIAVGGLFLLSSTPVGVVAAQESLPGRTGLVSGLVMGLAWGVGGLALTLIGWMADRFGLIAVMSVVALLPLVSAAAMCFYHEEQSPPVVGKTT